VALKRCSKTAKVVGIVSTGRHALEQRLSSIVLLIAIAYTSAIIQGIEIRASRVECYICRPPAAYRTQHRHSNFWDGLYD